MLFLSLQKLQGNSMRIYDETISYQELKYRENTVRTIGLESKTKALIPLTCSRSINIPRIKSEVFVKWLVYRKVTWDITKRLDRWKFYFYGSIISKNRIINKTLIILRLLERSFQKYYAAKKEIWFIYE